MMYTQRILTAMDTHQSLTLVVHNVKMVVHLPFDVILPSVTYPFLVHLSLLLFFMSLPLRKQN